MASPSGLDQVPPDPQAAVAIRRSLELLHEPGSVFEVRALGVPGRSKPHAESGYFSDIEQAVTAVVNYEYGLQRPAGIYTTLNVIDPALFARSPNTMLAYPEHTTSDRDVRRRRWLFLDFDADKPSGISSTDEELRAARDVARRTVELLTEFFGWPEPLAAMSGNGIHVLYRIDVEETRETSALIQQVLGAIAARVPELTTGSSAPKVNLDQKVSNAARMTKVYGTVVRKGAHTVDRPHRRSSLLVVPEQIQIVTLEQLKEVAATAAPSPRAQRSGSSGHRGSSTGATNHRLLVDAWLTARGQAFKVKDSPAADGRTVYLLAQCPFNPEHGVHGEVAIMQAHDGALSALCHHTSCTGKGWQEFKVAIGVPDPEHFDPPLRSSTAGRDNEVSRRAARSSSCEQDAPEHPYATLREAICSIAAVCDNASSQDKSGFNRNDAPLGHELAEKAIAAISWEVAEAREAYRMACYYWRQVRDAGINSECIPDPAAVEGKKTLEQLVKDAEVDPRAAIQRVLSDTQAVSDVATLRRYEKEVFESAMLSLRGSGAKARDVDAFEGAVRSKKVAPKKRTSHKTTDTDESLEEYRDSEGTLVWLKESEEGVTEVELANFTARILAQVYRDDGIESQLFLEIGGTVRNRPYSFTIPAQEFAAMNWVLPHVGPEAILSPGNGTRDRARAAIQTLSGTIPTRRIYTHSGWRQVDGVWVFLHAGGALGASGPVAGIEVSLDGALADVELPPPPTGEELVHGIRRALEVRRLGRDHIVLVGLAAVFRAVLGEALPVDFTVHLSGETGAFKTELAAILQGFFGARFSGRRLPGSFKSTANANERLLFAAKDLLVVIDEFCPQGTSADIARLHRDADSLLRGVGNRSGRGRLRADGSPRPTYTPRGLPITTGEDVPAGHSLRARMLVVEMGKGDIDAAELSRAQAARSEGVHSSVLSAYLAWIASRMEAMPQHLRGRQEALRNEFAAAGASHARAPDISASLLAGFEMFVRFAFDSRALSADDANQLLADVRAAIESLVSLQADLQLAEEPAGRFVTLLVAALSSGRCHLLLPEGSDHPAEPLQWGWRRREGTRPLVEPWTPLGPCVGWIDGLDIYLDPDAAYAAVQRFAGEQGGSMPVRLRTLARRLAERGYLASRDLARSKNVVRKTLQGKRREVLHLHRQTLVDPYLSGIGPIGPIGPGPLSHNDLGSQEMGLFGPTGPESAHEVGPIQPGGGLDDSPEDDAGWPDEPPPEWTPDPDEEGQPPAGEWGDPF